jgi:hypothetical protein
LKEEPGNSLNSTEESLKMKAYNFHWFSNGIGRGSTDLSDKAQLALFSFVESTSNSV